MRTARGPIYRDLGEVEGGETDSRITDSEAICLAYANSRTPAVYSDPTAQRLC